MTTPNSNYTPGTALKPGCQLRDTGSIDCFMQLDHVLNTSGDLAGVNVKPWVRERSAMSRALILREIPDLMKQRHRVTWEKREKRAEKGMLVARVPRPSAIQSRPPSAYYSQPSMQYNGQTQRPVISAEYGHISNPINQVSRPPSVLYGQTTPPVRQTQYNMQGVSPLSVVQPYTQPQQQSRNDSFDAWYNDFF